MKRLEIEANSFDERQFLVHFLALKGWKTWIEKRPDEESPCISKKYVICCEVPDEVVKEVKGK